MMRRFKVLIIGGVIAALFILGAAWYLFKGTSALSSAKSAYSSEKAKFAKLEKTKPYPNAENMATLRENSNNLKEARKEYEASLFAKPIKANITDGRVFLKQLRSKSQRWMKEAAAGAKEILLPLSPDGIPHDLEEDPYLFGFQNLADGTTPATVNVPRLSVQLQCVEAIKTILYNANVEEIASIKRYEFDVPDTSIAAIRAASRAVNPRLAGRGAAKPAAAKPAGAADAAPEGANSLYTIERFRVTFYAKEESIWDVINQFNNLPYPVAVKSLFIQNTNESFAPESIASDLAGLGQIAKEMQSFSSGSSVANEVEELEFITGLEDVMVFLALDFYRPPDPVKKEAAVDPAAKAQLDSNNALVKGTR